MSAMSRLLLSTKTPFNYRLREHPPALRNQIRWQISPGYDELQLCEQASHKRPLAIDSFWPTTATRTDKLRPVAAIELREELSFNVPLEGLAGSWQSQLLASPSRSDG